MDHQKGSCAASTMLGKLVLTGSVNLTESVSASVCIHKIGEGKQRSSPSQDTLSNIRNVNKYYVMQSYKHSLCTTSSLQWIWTVLPWLCAINDFFFFLLVITTPDSSAFQGQGTGPVQWYQPTLSLRSYKLNKAKLSTVIHKNCYCIIKYKV